MAVSQTHLQQGLCTSPANGIPSGKDIPRRCFPSTVEKQTVRCEASGVRRFPVTAQLRFQAVFPLKPCPAAAAPRARPPRTLRPIPRLGDGWEPGSAKPRSIRKDFLSQLQRPFQGRSLPLPISTAGQPLSFPVDKPTRPCEPCAACPFPQASTGIQRKPCSIVHLQHLHTQPRTRLRTHPSPLFQPQILQWLYPTSIWRRSVIPSPCFSTCSQRAEACFNCVYWREISLIQTHKSRAKITLEQQGEMPGYEAPSQTSDRNLPRQKQPKKGN